MTREEAIVLFEKQLTAAQALKPLDGNALDRLVGYDGRASDGRR